METYFVIALVGEWNMEHDVVDSNRISNQNEGVAHRDVKQILNKYQFKTIFLYAK